MRNIFYIILLIIPQISSFLWKYPFPFIKSKNIEITENIIYNPKNEDATIIKKINGFYGLVGPDVNITKVKTLYELFMGNGVIQGVFFDEGNLTFVKKFVKTDKFIHDEILNTFDLKKIIMNFKNINILFPNILGLANTALFLVNKKVYVLFERDQPYLLDVDFLKKDIYTLSKINIKELYHFSAHSKIKDNIIETIDYKILDKVVTYHQMDVNFKSIFKKDFKMKYFPIMHDFLSTDKSVILFDCPLKAGSISFGRSMMNVILDYTKPTIINVMNKETKIIDKYLINESFYIFHFADFYEDDDIIEIYASLYDKLDFSSLNLDGKYRKIIIDKKTKNVSIEKNIELEKMNLDFPVKYKNKIILKNLENDIINGFVICEKLHFCKKIIVPNKCICGEPVIKVIDDVPYLICFALGLNNGCVMIINLNNYKIIEIPINSSLNIGFHSIFIES